MRNAIVAAVMAALVASGGTYAATSYGSGLVVKRGPLTLVAAGERGFTSVSCPSGRFATGGGYTSSDIPSNQGGGAYVTDSAPAPISTTRSPNGWAVSVVNPTAAPVTVQAYVVCGA